MTKKQLRALNFLYAKPLTLEQLLHKLGTNYEASYGTDEYHQLFDKAFLDCVNVPSNHDCFKASLLSLENAGREIVENRRRDNRH